MKQKEEIGSQIQGLYKLYYFPFLSSGLVICLKADAANCRA